MKTVAQRRGSVLMEFIIVFPIYLILFAGMVMTGDMLVHSNRLVSADRVAAYEVDGRVAGYAAKGFASQAAKLAMSWHLIPGEVFHPGEEIADDGTNQDFISSATTNHYADATGPWSVCALASVHDSYKPLAGGTLGQLLAARMLVGGSGAVVLDELQSGVDMVSKDTRNGASFYTLKRRDVYYQRLIEREGYNEYIRPDSGNWRDRNFVSRLLRTQGRPKTENWRLEVAGEGWHTVDTICGRDILTSCSEANGTRIDDYRRYDEFADLSD